jgi:hypothetical protein
MSPETSLKLLNEMVDALGLQAVADQTGYSKSAICHIQQGTYRGRADKVLRRVEEVFSQRAVLCPVLGEITFARCVEERNRPFAAVNPLRVRLARTCPTCGVRR